MTIKLLLIYVLSWGLCFSQGPQDAVRQDPLKAAGSFYVYDYENASELSPAPDGYVPFYISHFGRHGARFCTSEYDSVYEWFSKASRENLLTAAGRDFFSRYEAFYNSAKYCKGNLTGVGKAQHSAIAEHMFSRFPEVFDGPTRVEAVSTESARVIMSMWSCLSRLQSLDGDMELAADASGCYAPWLQPPLSSSPYYIKNGYSCGPAADEVFEAYFQKTVPWKKVAKKFFSSADVLEKCLKTTPEKFMDRLHAVVTCTRCLDDDQGCFDDVFSEEELRLTWKGVSARYFMSMANFEGTESLAVDYAAFTLGQMIESADADILSGGTQLRLRFGHDSGIAPLLVLLDLNGFGETTSSLEKSLEIFPCYNIPMGASLQLVFYRNQEGDILIRVLLNEREASLPIPSVQGNFYRWSDFKEHYLPLVDASKQKIEQLLK